MKTKQFLPLATLVLFASCSAPTQQVTVSLANAEMNDQTVYLVNQNAETTDTLASAAITNQSFNFTFEVPKNPQVYSIVGDKRFRLDFIAEAADLSINLDTEGNSTYEKAGALNTTLKELNDTEAKLSKEFRAFYEANRKDNMKAVYEERDRIIAELETTYETEMHANKDNIIGAVCAGSIVSNYETLAQVDSIIAIVPSAADYYQVARHRAQLVKAERTQPGKMFVDFKAESVDGKEVALSDYVGKGQYVLVDFWASWCGPCMAEIPNLKAVHKLYKDKGFVMLGVNVWEREKANFYNAIEKKALAWTNIYASANNDATDLYGIRGIPTIILFAPDGTIVDRTLRGQAIKDKLAEIYE